MRRRCRRGGAAKRVADEELAAAEGARAGEGGGGGRSRCGEGAVARPRVGADVEGVAGLAVDVEAVGRERLEGRRGGWAGASSAAVAAAAGRRGVGRAGGGAAPEGEGVKWQRP